MANKQYKNCSKLKKDKQNLEMREKKEENKQKAKISTDETKSLYN